jgi:hypothetical protein
MPYQISHKTAAAGNPTDNKNRQWRKGLDRLKYSMSMRCASFLVVRVRGTSRLS